MKLLLIPKYALLLLLALPISANIANAGVKYRTVEAKGTGTSLEHAIDRGLVNAITQVNGAAIASRARSALSQGSKTVGGKRTTTTQKSFSEAIAKKTKGIVKSYEILSQTKDATSGIHRVTLTVSVAYFKMSSQLKRLKMAVVPFRIGGGLKKTGTVQRFEETFRRSLENYLTQSRRFAILDRSFIEEQDKEGAFIKGGGTAPEELARLGNRVGTDYLITGVVEKAYSYVKKTKMRTTGQVIRTPQIGGRITYRILDVASTQVKFAATDKLHSEGGSLSNTADKLAKKVGQRIVNAIFPIYVLSFDNNTVTLGQGGDTVKRGAVYTLVRLGRRMIDPHTNESLGRKETTVGSVRITDTQSKMSTGKILKLTIRKSALLRDDFIVRPRKGASGPKKRARKMKDLEKEIDKEFADDDKEDEKDSEKW